MMDEDALCQWIAVANEAKSRLYVGSVYYNHNYVKWMSVVVMYAGVIHFNFNVNTYTLVVIRDAFDAYL